MVPQLDHFTSAFLIVFYVIASLVLVGLVGFAAWAVWKLHNLLEKYEARINPVIDKADHVLNLISEKVDTIGGKAESILTQGEEMAESVHEKVDRTATTVQRTINAPIIKVNSLAAALTQGFATFTRLQQKDAHRPNGQRSPYAMELEEKPEEIIRTNVSNGATGTVHEDENVIVEVSETSTDPLGRVTPVTQEEQPPLVLGRKG